jgi:predicted nucleic acid-binding protein
MKVLLDTNILSRIVETGHLQHRAALDATDLLGRQKHDLVLVPQILYEFWAVCTRPLTANGLGRTVAEAESELAHFKSFFTILDESPLTLAEWEQRVVSLQIIGKNAHDTHLVAAMACHGISHLLSFNDQDFRRYSDITVITPDAVLNPPVSP